MRFGWPPARRIALGIVMALLAGVLLWLAAQWIRLFLAPKETRSPAVAPVASVDRAADRIAAAHLFGTASAARPADTSKVSTLKIRLKGVLAGKENGPGYAIVNSGGPTDLPVKVGGEILPSVTLVSVYPTHIVLNRAGILERVNLDDKQAEAAAKRGLPGPGSSPQRPGSAPASAQSKPGVSRVEPNIASADSAAAQGGAQNPDGGLTISQVPGGSVAEKLGLQPGDVLLSVNGQPLRNPAELGPLYARFSPGDDIVVEALRDGVTVQFTPTE